MPSEVSSWLKIENQARQILHNYNYKEIRTPVFEETELFSRSMGQTSDVVMKQMLNLASQSAKDSNLVELSGLTLRPEGTASIVRSYIQHGLDRKDSLSKLFYIGPMFRGERPQKGRLRQFHQIGAEAIGPQSDSPYLDAELIALSVHLLKSFGLEKFEVRINTLGTSEDKANFSQWLKEKIKPFLPQLNEDDQLRYDRNVLRILDSKDKAAKKVLADINVGISHLSVESVEYFEKVKQALKSLDISFIEDHNLVRGLDYYTHTVFEISSGQLGSQDALGAGGRYANLVSDLGGPKVDAVGFALGIERILLAAAGNQESNNADLLDVFIIAFGDVMAREASLLLHEIRQQNLSADMSYKQSSAKSLMRQADKSGAKFVIILGEEEQKQGKLILKNMISGEQQLLERARVVKDLFRLISG